MYLSRIFNFKAYRIGDFKFSIFYHCYFIESDWVKAYLDITGTRQTIYMANS